MKVVFQDFIGWKDKPHAERELGYRMENAAKKIGVEGLYTDDYDKIEKFKPDIVFPLHHFTPKLFDAYTIGCMWNPADFILEADRADGVYPLENIKSYDAFAVASAQIKNFLSSLCFKSPFKREIYEIYPTSTYSKYSPVSDFKKVTYIGSNWQLKRHSELFLKSDKIAVYGPRKNWEYLINEGRNYCGEVPFGSSYVRNVYRSNGIGLCFHGENHLKDNIPNMRVFEMAASGVLIFADKLPFIEEHFGDSVRYIDTSQDTESIIEQIDYQYNWVLKNKSKAKEMAVHANEIFNKNFTLEKLLKDIFASYEGRSQLSSLKEQKSSVEIIVRTDGNRPRLQHSIESFASQIYKNLIITFVYWGNNKKEFEKKIAEIVPTTLRYRILEMKGRKDRSFNLYHGISSSTADFIGICDDDDILFKDHISSLVKMLEQDKELAVAYSGVIMNEISKRGNNRELFFFHDFSHFNEKSYITSNSYLVRRTKLPHQIFGNEIPNVSTGEDRMFLDLIYFDKGKFAFSERSTSLFFRDLVHQDNISSNIKEWKKNQSFYKAFLKESSLEKDYLHYRSKAKKVQEEPEKESKRVTILKKIFEKLIPFRIRRFILLLVKQLVQSSEKI